MSGLDSWSRDALDWTTTMFVWTGVLFLVALLLDRGLSRRVSPTWRMLLYAAIPLRLVMPTWVATPLGMGATVTLPAVPSAPAAHTAAATASAQLASGPVWWDALPLIVYCVGVAVLGGLWARRRMRPVVGTAVPHLADHAGGFPVLAVPRRGPEAIGVLRRRIVLPTALLDAASHARLRWIVRHERGHLERHDPALFALVQTAAIVLWPLLPVWCAVARLRALAEMACDARVLRDADREARSDYLETLLMTPTRLSRLAPVAAFAAGGLDERVAALRPRRTWPGLVQAAVVMSAALVAAACSSLSETVEDQPDDTVMLMVEATDLGDAGALENDEPPQVLIGTRLVRADQNASKGLHIALGTAESADVWIVDRPEDATLHRRVGVRVLAAPSIVTRTGEDASLFLGDSVQRVGDRSLVVLATRRDGSLLATLDGENVYLPSDDSDSAVRSGLLVRTIAHPSVDGDVPLRVELVIVENGTVTREVSSDVTVPKGRAVILIARPPEAADN